MDDADEKPMVSIDPRYLLTGDVVERPPDERRNTTLSRQSLTGSPAPRNKFRR